ncbi:hypothetical protein [Paenibacillus xylaniclasticus]|uniref:hypothetical protein n=1 Tax=Paenibacillus xylaniclasticus TaxID=588083 RepID=UPI000FDC0686|nr:MULTISPECIES: hypothetical protein [Paenibacillus]GFN31328.1 hypothetical protein PCURB6_15880 [Paenibacillus curdlanolyticus]
MWRMFGWVGRAIAVGLIASFLSIWTTGYIVNSYLETLLKQYNLPLEVQPFALSGVWGKLWGADPVKQGTSVAEVKQGGQGTSSGSSSSSSVESAGEADSLSGDGNGEASGPVDDGGSLEGSAGGADSRAAGTTRTDNADASKVDAMSDPAAADAFGREEESVITGEGSGTGPKAEAGAAEAAAEEISGTSGILTDADRDELFDLLATKLPQQAWQSISEYMESGLTEEEVSNVQQIVAQYLSEDQYRTFMSILKKY